MNNSAIWLVNTKPQNKQMNYRFSPEKRAINVGIQYHRLLNNDVKRTTKLDGMGPFKSSIKIFTLFALRMYIVVVVLLCINFFDNLKRNFKLLQ